MISTIVKFIGDVFRYRRGSLLKKLDGLVGWLAGWLVGMGLVGGWMDGIWVM